MPTPVLDSGQFSSEVSQFVVDHRRSRAEPAPGVRTGYVETLHFFRADEARCGRPDIGRPAPASRGEFEP
jgi:hypothetical protein